ncbi:MAG: sensor histidine kinase [Cellulosilyticaceae bacterium]
MNREKIGLNHIIRGYRYISLIISSVFYIIVSIGSLDKENLAVLLGMAVCCVLTDYLYQENQENTHNTAIVILIEIVTNTVLINISGGLNSYYIWYSLNSVLMITLKYGKRWAWCNLFFYIGVMIKNNTYIGVEMMNILNLNSLLGLILVTAMFQWIIQHYKLALEKNKKLVGKQFQMKQSLEYIMDNYEMVYLFANEKSKEKVVEILLNYVELMLGVSQVAYIEYEEQGEGKVYSKALSEDLALKIHQKIKKYLLVDGLKSFCRHIRYEEKSYMIVPITYSEEYFGTLMIQAERKYNELTFIAYLTSITFKRIELEKLYESFVISGEQNRIANHIHDGILQKLFGISCNLYTMGKTLDTKTEDEVEKEILEIRLHINNAMTELRETIYGMSWNKNGTSSFTQSLQKYIDEMKYLYKREIFLEVKGDLQCLPHRHKEAIYRIVCEGVSNGIRHGKASKICARVEIHMRSTQIAIKDNGIGFNYEQLLRQDLLGLGIKNMGYLANTFGGQLQIDSRRGMGTTISMVLLNREEDIEAMRVRGIYKGEQNEIINCG